MLRTTVAALVLSLGLAAQQTCSVTHAGNGCGPTLTVSFTPTGNNQRLDLTATGLFPHTIVGMVWGMNQVNIPLPGGLCPQLTDYVWGHSMMSDSLGEASWSRAWPWSFQGYFYMQMGSIQIHEDGSFSVVTTNCELAQCHN